MHETRCEGAGCTRKKKSRMLGPAAKERRRAWRAHGVIGVMCTVGADYRALPTVHPQA